MPNPTGSRWERTCINIFDDNGYGAIRVPSSGSSTKRELPDVHVGRKGRSIAAEVKYRGQGKDRIYVQEEKVEGLQWFAEQFGSECYIAARYGGNTDWAMVDPDTAERTPSGNISIHRREIGEWPTLEDVISEDKP